MQHAFLECVFLRARRARLEMRSHLRHIVRRELSVEIIVDPTENLLARVAIEGRHDAR